MQNGREPENTDSKWQQFFSNNWEGARELKIYIKTDVLTGDTITHFRVSQDDEWTPAPTWTRQQFRPRIALMDAERWNAASPGAKYVLMLAGFSYQGITMLMRQKRRDKWFQQVLVTRVHYDRITHEGWLTFETLVDDQRLYEHMMKMFEHAPMMIVEAEAGEQLQLFGVPLFYSNSTPAS